MDASPQGGDHTPYRMFSPNRPPGQGQLPMRLSSSPDAGLLTDSALRRVAQLERDIGILRRENVELRERCTSLAEQRERDQQLIDELRDANVSSAIHTAETHKDTQLELTRLKEANKQLKADLLKAETDRQLSMIEKEEAEVDAAEEVEKLRKALATAESNTGIAEQALKTLLAQQEEDKTTNDEALTAKNGRIEALEGELAEAEGKRKLAEGVVGSLKTNAETINAELNRARAELAEKDQKLAFFADEVKVLNAVVKNATTQQQVADAAVAAANAESAALREENNVLSSAKTQRDHAERRALELMATVEELKTTTPPHAAAQIASLTEALEEADAQQRQSTARIDELEGAVAQLEEDLATLRERNSMLAASVAPGGGDDASARAASPADPEVHELRRALEITQRQRNQAECDAEALMEKVEALEAQLRAAGERAAVAEGKPPAPAAASTVKIGGYDIDADRLKSSLHQAVLRRDEVERENARLRGELEAAAAAADDRNGHHHAAAAEAEAAAAEEARHALAVRELELQEALDMVDQLREKLDALNTDLLTTREQCHLATEELQRAAEELADARDSECDARARLEQAEASRERAERLNELLAARLDTAAAGGVGAGNVGGPGGGASPRHPTTSIASIERDNDTSGVDGPSPARTRSPSVPQRAVSPHPAPPTQAAAKVITNLQEALARTEQAYRGLLLDYQELQAQQEGGEGALVAPTAPSTIGSISGGWTPDDAAAAMGTAEALVTELADELKRATRELAATKTELEEAMQQRNQAERAGFLLLGHQQGMAQQQQQQQQQVRATPASSPERSHPPPVVPDGYAGATDKDLKSPQRAHAYKAEVEYLKATARAAEQERDNAERISEQLVERLGTLEGERDFMVKRLAELQEQVDALNTALYEASAGPAVDEATPNVAALAEQVEALNTALQEAYQTCTASDRDKESAEVQCRRAEALCDDLKALVAEKSRQLDELVGVKFGGRTPSPSVGSAAREGRGSPGAETVKKIHATTPEDVKSLRELTAELKLRLDVVEGQRDQAERLGAELHHALDDVRHALQEEQVTAGAAAAAAAAATAPSTAGNPLTPRELLASAAALDDREARGNSKYFAPRPPAAPGAPGGRYVGTDEARRLCDAMQAALAALQTDLVERITALQPREGVAAAGAPGVVAEVAALRARLAAAAKQREERERACEECNAGVAALRARAAAGAGGMTPHAQQDLEVAREQRDTAARDLAAASADVDALENMLRETLNGAVLTEEAAARAQRELADQHAVLAAGLNANTTNLQNLQADPPPCSPRSLRRAKMGEYEALSALLEGAAAQRAHATQVTHDLTTTVRTLEQELARKLRDLDTENEKVAALRGTLQDARGRTVKADAAKVQAARLAQHLAAAGATAPPAHLSSVIRDEHEKELHALKGRRAAADAERDRTARASEDLASEVAGLEAALEEKLARVFDGTQEARELEDRVRTAVKQRDQVATHRRDAGVLHSAVHDTLAALRAEIDINELQAPELRQLLEEAVAAHEDAVQARAGTDAQVVALERELRALLEQPVAAASVVDTHTAQQEYDTVAHRLEALCEEAEQTAARVKDAESQRDQFDDLCLLFATTIDTLERKAGTAGPEGTPDPNAERMLKDALERRGHAEAEAEKFRQEAEGLAAALAEEQRAVAAAEAELAGLRSQLDGPAAPAHDSAEALAALRRQVDAAHLARDQTADAVARTAARVAEVRAALQREMSEKGEEIAKLQRDLTEAGAHKSETEQLSDQLKDAIEQLQRDLNAEMLRESEVNETEDARLLQRVKDTEARRDHAERLCEALQNALQSLHADTEGSLVPEAATAAQVEQLQAELLNAETRAQRSEGVVKDLLDMVDVLEEELAKRKAERIAAGVGSDGGDDGSTDDAVMSPKIRSDFKDLRGRLDEAEAQRDEARRLCESLQAVVLAMQKWRPQQADAQQGEVEDAYDASVSTAPPSPLSRVSSASGPNVTPPAVSLIRVELEKAQDMRRELEGHLLALRSHTPLDDLDDHYRRHSAAGRGRRRRDSIVLEPDALQLDLPGQALGAAVPIGLARFGSTITSADAVTPTQTALVPPSAAGRPPLAGGGGGAGVRELKDRLGHVTAQRDNAERTCGTLSRKIDRIERDLAAKVAELQELNANGSPERQRLRHPHSVEAYAAIKARLDDLLGRPVGERALSEAVAQRDAAQGLCSDLYDAEQALRRELAQSAGELRSLHVQQQLCAESPPAHTRVYGHTMGSPERRRLERKEAEMAALGTRLTEALAQRERAEGLCADLNQRIEALRGGELVGGSPSPPRGPRSSPVLHLPPNEDSVEGLRARLDGSRREVDDLRGRLHDAQQRLATAATFGAASAAFSPPPPGSLDAVAAAKDAAEARCDKLAARVRELQESEALGMEGLRQRYADEQKKREAAEVLHEDVAYELRALKKSLADKEWELEAAGKQLRGLLSQQGGAHGNGSAANAGDAVATPTSTPVPAADELASLTKDALEAQLKASEAQRAADAFQVNTLTQELAELKASLTSREGRIAADAESEHSDGGDGSGPALAGLTPAAELAAMDAPALRRGVAAAEERAVKAALEVEDLTKQVGTLQAALATSLSSSRLPDAVGVPEMKGEDDADDAPAAAAAGPSELEQLRREVVQLAEGLEAAEEEVAREKQRADAAEKAIATAPGATPVTPQQLLELAQELDTAGEALRAALARVNALEAALSQSAERMQTVQLADEITTAEEALAAAKARVDEIGSNAGGSPPTDDAAVLRAQVAGLTAELDAAKVHLADLQSGAADTPALRSQMASLADALEKAEDEAEQARTRAAALEAAAAANMGPDATRQVGLLKQQMKELAVEFEGCEAEAEAAKKRVAELEAILKAGGHKFHDELAEADKSMRGLEANLKEAERDADKRANMLARQVVQLADDLDEADAHAAAAAGRIQALEEALQAHGIAVPPRDPTVAASSAQQQRRTQQLTAQLMELANELEETEAALAAARTRIADLERELADANDPLEASSTSMTKLRQRSGALFEPPPDAVRKRRNRSSAMVDGNTAGGADAVTVVPTGPTRQRQRSSAMIEGGGSANSSLVGMRTRTAAYAAGGTESDRLRAMQERLTDAEDRARAAERMLQAVQDAERDLRARLHATEADLAQSEFRNEELAGAIDELNASMVLKEREVQAIKEHLEGLEAPAVSPQELQRLREELEEAAADRDDARAECVAYQSTIKRLRENLSDKITQLVADEVPPGGASAEELAELNARLAQAEAERDRAVDTCEKLRKNEEVEDLKDQLEMTERLCEDMHARVADLEGQLAAAKDAAAAAGGDPPADADEELREALEQRDRAKAWCRTLTDTLEAVRGSMLEQVNRLVGQLDSPRDIAPEDVDAAIEIINGLSSNIRRLGEGLSEGKGRIEEIYTPRGGVLRPQGGGGDDSFDAIAAAEEIEALEERLAETEKQRDSVAALCDDLMGKLKDVDEGLLEELKVELRASEAAREQAEALARTYQTKVEELKAQLKEAEEERDEILDELRVAAMRSPSESPGDGGGGGGSHMIPL